MIIATDQSIELTPQQVFQSPSDNLREEDKTKHTVTN